MSAGVTRPVWRTYDPRFVANAAAHVRAGGHAVVRDARWYILLPCDEDGVLGELSAWTLLDLAITAFDVVAEGDAAGLVKAPVPRGKRELVAEWCERDATLATSTTSVELDCRTCAHCCRANHVVLEDEDFERWAAAGQGALGERAYVRKERGRRALRVLRSGDCVHLRGNECAIYELRPNNCRAFPAGSEGCLSARRDAGLKP